MRQSIDEANNGAIALGTHSLIRGGTSATPSPATTPVPIPGAIGRSLSISARGSSYNTQATATPGSFATVTEQQSQPQQYAEDNNKQLGFFGSNNDNGSSGNGAAVSTTHPSSIAQSLGANSAIDPLSQVSHPNTPGGDVPKDKSKSKNFFLRSLTLRGRSSSSKYNDFDSDSEFGGDPRMNGFNARVFSQAVGYTPHHKEPPRYIRTKAANKKERDFGRVFLAQELVGTRPPGYNNTQNTQQEGDKQEGGTNKGDAPAQGGETNGMGSRGPTVTVSVASASGRKVAKTGGAIWATEFSRDGKYFAAAGKDNVVRVWAVISTPEERRAHEEEEAAANGGNTTGERLSAPVFRDRPLREFVGHSGEVLDLSWSKNNFLLSSSMDKTVRLWHISRQECLCTFKHKDFVTRLAFHPRDDRFFLAGSLDTILRLWSIPDKQIAFSAQCPDLITAVAFSPDGKTAIAGLLNGLCLFYETEGLKPQAQVHVRSSRGKNAKGSKITGIQTITVPPPDPLKEQSPGAGTGDEAQGEVKVLITSNDSRVRIYNLRDKSLEIKLKGHDNSVSQIAASFSDDGKYVICGSEDKKAFIWGLNGGQQRAAYIDKEKSPYEYFEAHGEMVTTAVFAPTKTRMLLGRSEDPIYDLCNPPPVVLRSAGEEAATASAHSAAASQTELSSEDHHQPAPLPPTVPTSAPIQRPEPSPAYIARSTHYDGNIIVTTDGTGIIKVFRQDCAYTKRKHDSWETGSTFSRKLTSHGGSLYNGRLGRSISVLSRTSAGTGSAAHSRRGSMSGNNAPYMVTSPVSHASALTQAVNAGSDRILSWRMGIENGADAGGNGVAGPRPGQVGTAPGNRSSAIVNGSNRCSGVQTPTHSDRSLSPVRGGPTSSVPVGAGNRASMPAAVSVPSTPNRNINIHGVGVGTSTPNGATNGYPHGHSHLATHTEANKSNLLESPANLTPLNRVNTMGTGTELGSPTRSVPMDITPERNRQAREREEREGRPGSPPAPGFSFRPARAGTGTGEERRGSGPQDSDQHDGSNGGHGNSNGSGNGSGGISFWNPLKGMGWKVGIPGFGKNSTPSYSSGQRPGSSGLDKEGASGKGHNRSMSAGVNLKAHIPSPLAAEEGEGSYGVSPGITPWDVPLLATTDEEDDLNGSANGANGGNGYANGHSDYYVNGNGHTRSQSTNTITGLQGLQRPPLIVPTIINTRPSGDEEDRPELEVLQQQQRDVEMEREKGLLERERERSKEREKQRER
ncbi:hypothetical protein N0V85_009324, partial [Neurospora sp. IMI 360204]